MESLTLSDVGVNESEVIRNNAYYQTSPTGALNNTLTFDFPESNQLNQYLTKSSAIPSLFDSGNMNGDILGKNEETYVDGMFNNSSSHLNNRTFPELPIDMQFNEGNRLAIIIYSLLMVISAVGNISVFSALIRLRMKGRLSRINLFLLHLAIADLLVTFLMMPLEIVWNATVSWKAGDTMCRVMSFFRIFGLLLSGNVLVCISLDRYFAILKPLAMPNANSRGRTMLAVGWLMSVLCSLPQSFIFHVEKHPDFSWYEQCVTFNSFPSPEYELAYNFFGFFFLYGVPLITIIFCYSRILYEIYRINALKKNENELRRSNMGALGRAKIRTLKMTVIIVATFFFCWTPYNVMSLWYWFDKKSALEVDQRIQKGLFLFACTNSCVNPLIYGLFHFRPKKKSTGSTVPNAYHRPPIPSENYKMRVRWRQPDCCIMGCGSSGNSDSTTATRGHENHFHVRPGQQTWVRDGPRHFHSTQCPAEHYNVHQQQIHMPKCRNIKIGANGHMNGGGMMTINGSAGLPSSDLRRCGSIKTVACDKHGFRASTCCVEHPESSAIAHFIDDDKRSKRHCLSSIL